MWMYGTITQYIINMILKKGAIANSILKSLEELFQDNKDTYAIELENKFQTMVLGDPTIS